MNHHAGALKLRAITEQIRASGRAQGLTEAQVRVAAAVMEPHVRATETGDLISTTNEPLSDFLSWATASAEYVQRIADLPPEPAPAATPKAAALAGRRLPTEAEVIATVGRDKLANLEPRVRLGRLNGEAQPSDALHKHDAVLAQMQGMKGRK